MCRHRWSVERSLAWLLGCHRLPPRYERNPRNYLAFLTLAAALVSFTLVGVMPFGG
ncbi:hypothetical protein ACLLO4_16585 [Kutzneria viridogrisea]|uniref:transposase n=1 Tax=Kutzneria viridogrisea TaxID=47990 RepID=UPI0016025483